MTEPKLSDSASALIRAGIEFPAAVVHSENHPLLQRLASGHASYQAGKCRQGHQRFDSRYEEIRVELGLSAAEIAAESWPWQENQPLFVIGIEMFRCWRQSLGHWRIADAVHRYFGADMTKGRNGVWYACILVAD